MVATLFVSSLVAADESQPDMDFIEYLGLWEESDEEWMLFDESEDTTEETRSDPASVSKESPEKHDED
ncbi:MAG: hypothetical protein AAF351_01480 [Pseudomonadota bacterium]